MKQQDKIRLLIDASRLEGWENIAALENHAAFVKAHQQEVERIAVIARHEWQHWLVGAVRVFLHPDVKVFDKGDENAALTGSRAEGNTLPPACRRWRERRCDCDPGALQPSRPTL